MLKRFLLSVCAGLVALVTFASQIKPDEASSNLAAWAKIFGAENVPAWIQSKSIDTYTLVIGLILLFVFGLLYFYWQYREKLKTRQPIEIVFDPKNPSKKYWSHLPTAGGHEFFEYRVEIKNLTEKTLYEVVVSIEWGGIFPTSSEDARFKRGGSTSRTLHPLESDLAVVMTARIGPQAGNLSGPSARAYGDLIVKVSAKDTKQIVRAFHFDPNQVPVIFDDRTGRYAA